MYERTIPPGRERRGGGSPAQRDVWAAFRADVEAMAGGGGRLRTIARALVLPQVRAVAYFRLGQVLARRGLLPIAYVLRARALARTGAELHPLAQIGPGFNLVHTAGVVVGGDVVIGARAWVFQGVTLGCGGIPGQPRLGDDVLIGAGAKVLGGVRVGDRVTVAANAVVGKDIPDDATARGVPAVVALSPPGARDENGHVPQWTA